MGIDCIPEEVVKYLLDVVVNKGHSGYCYFDYIVEEEVEAEGDIQEEVLIQKLM